MGYSGGVPFGSIFSGTISREVEGGFSGEVECGTRRFALFWKETSEGGGAEVVDVEISRMVRAIVRAEGLSRVSTAAVGSGEVAESWKVSVAV